MIAFFPRYQRSLIYRPVRAKLTPADAMLAPGSVHEIAVRTEDGLTLNGWHLLPKGRAVRNAAGCDRELGLGRPVVLYFPGNSGHRLYRRDELELLSGLNVDVLAFDYRGYGDNPGQPEEGDIARDARAIWNYANKVRGIPSQRILLYGESLGGAIATRLAADCCRSQQLPRGLILRSTFSCLADVGAHWFPYLPARWIVMEKYPSQTCIARITCPLLQLHGKWDNVVPPELGQALFDRAPAVSHNGIAKQFVQLPNANHDNVVFADRQRLHDALRQFLTRIAAVESLPIESLSIPRPHFLSAVNVARSVPWGYVESSLGRAS